MPTYSSEPPSVSVVLPVYNDGQYLPESLSGIFAQTLLPEKVILIDDASTDNTLSVMQDWQQRYPHVVQIITNKANQGSSPSYLIGIEHVTTDYIWFHAADDIFLPQFLEKQYKLASCNPQAALVSSDIAIFKNDPANVITTLENWADEARYYSPDEVVKRVLMNQIHCHCLVRKEALIAADCLEPRLRYHIDWFWNLVMSFRHGMGYIPEVLSMMRSRPDSYSAARWSNREDVYDTYGCILQMLHEPRYQDIIPKFIKSEAARVFSTSMVEYVAQSGQFYDLLNQQLLKPIAAGVDMWGDVTIEGHIEKTLLAYKPCFDALVKKTHALKIAVYGAGKHTEYLLPKLETLWKVQPHAVLVSDKGSQQSTTRSQEATSEQNKLELSNRGLGLGSIPVYSIDDVNLVAYDLFILSSKMHEATMHAVLQNRQHDCRIFSIWNPYLSHF